MDQMKTGSFLKKLRNEKNITQEQLAEKLNVSGRTVSRWETGTNMPDISLLVELAEFYEVSIVELIDGERTDKKMNEEVKTTALKLSEYTEAVNRNINKILLRMTLATILGFAAFVHIESNHLGVSGSIYEKISSAGLGLTAGMLTVYAMFFSGVLVKIKARVKMYKDSRKIK